MEQSEPCQVFPYIVQTLSEHCPLQGPYHTESTVFLGVLKTGIVIKSPSDKDTPRGQ